MSEFHVCEKSPVRSGSICCQHEMHTLVFLVFLVFLSWEARYWALLGVTPISFLNKSSKNMGFIVFLHFLLLGEPPRYWALLGAKKEMHFFLGRPATGRYWALLGVTPISFLDKKR